MSAPTSVVRAVTAVLRMHARNGRATKRAVRTDVIGKIRNAGGPTKMGIGRAMMEMAVAQIVDVEVTRQMKAPLSEHQQRFTLPATTPPEIIAAIGKVPQWIAISDGTDAIWIPSLIASPMDWMCNFDLKDKKARQTQKAADVSLDIGRFLSMFKFASLAEAMQKGAP